MTEIDKWANVHEEAKAILNFWDWAEERKPQPWDSTNGILQIVYEYFDIDPDELEKERTALLKRYQDGK